MMTTVGLVFLVHRGNCSLLAREDRATRSDLRAQDLFERHPQPMWVYEPKTDRLLRVNDAAASAYGYSREEFLAKTALDIRPSDQMASFLAAADMFMVGPGSPGVFRHLRKDGSTLLARISEHQVQLQGAPCRDGDGRGEELQQANIELEAFSRTAAHDLKSPLNGIVGMSGLLRLRAADKLDDTERRYLEIIERSSRDMATLINDLLALSRAGSVELERTTADLAPFVRTLFDQLQTLEPLRRVEVDMPDRLEMHCDEGLMRSVLQNLITNAWKFTSELETARLSVALVDEGDSSTLKVSDNGAGFDASGVGELLRPFQRFHTQAQFKGTGLGLVTCQRIAHRHGGRLSLQSTPGEGTVVSVTLPKATAVDAGAA